MSKLTNYVTGASGFIGKHLVSKLGDDTVTIPHGEIFDHDYEDCRNFFYLASYGNMAEHTDITKILRANIGMVGRVLEGIIDGEFQCEHFIYVSSSSVMLPVQTPYSRAKRAAEEMILASGIAACIVRPFSVTGVGEQRQHLIPTLIRSCMEGEKVNLSPWPTHDWVDVEDVVTGLIRLATTRATGVFEFGSGIARSNIEILRLVEFVCEKPANVEIIENANRPYDIVNWTRRNANIFFDASKSLHQSVVEMVEAYRNAK